MNKTYQKQGLTNTKVLYSSNHNLLRTVGFITILMAVPCLDWSMALRLPDLYRNIGIIS